MKRIASVFLPLALALPMVVYGAQEGSGRERDRIVQQVRKEINSLTNYGVFDSINYEMDGSTVTLQGYASRPTLKDSAERVVAKIEGVDKVINQIEVLPLSNMDDGIRARMYRAIYGDNVLSRYNPSRGPIMFSPARIAGGITNDPPIGLHSIHLVVRNGNVLLTGVVDNKADSDRANIVANGVFGVFSVNNQLQIASKTRKK